MKKPILSIIIPVYNVEQYLNKCIDSILSQTFTDFELILADDGSTDNSGKICDKYSKIDPRIIVIHKENGGQSSARNAGLNIASGKYITFVDSDDYISNDCYYKNIRILLENKSIDILQYPIYIVNSNSTEKMKIPGYKNETFLLTKKDFFSFWSDGGIGVRGFVWQNIYKSDIFKDIRFKEGVIFEDCYIQSDILEKADIVYISGYGKYYYVQRENSTLHSKDSLKRCVGDFEATIRYLEKMQTYNVDTSLMYKCYCITKNRMIDKTYKYGYESFYKYFDRIDSLNIGLCGIIKSNIEVKMKIKILLSQILGNKNYFHITKKIFNR